MKKLVIVAIAVLLAMPVLSHAGSATSKWDLTIGGFVLMQAGWADQEVGSGVKNAARRTGIRENQTDEFGTFFAHSEGRLNFIVKGPDAWGAKTAGRLEFDFLSNAAGVIGDSVLRHAYLTFDWANTQLLIGNTWYGAYDTGMPPPGATLASLPNPGIPSRAPQVRLTQKFGKNFTASFGLEYPGLGNWMAAGNNYVDEYTRSKYPNVYATAKFASDACGKIGPMMLTFGASGVYGRKSVVYATANTVRGTIFHSKQDDGWLAHAFAYVPIIPEKNMNKAGALSWYGGVLTGQGLTRYNAAVFPTAFIASRYANTPGFQDLSTPKGYGLYTGMYFYILDNLYVSPSYTDQFAQVSNRFRENNINTAIRNTLYNLALVYDPNPAVRLGVEYTRLVTGYAGPGYIGNVMGANKKHGTLNELRFSAQYLF